MGFYCQYYYSYIRSLKKIGAISFLFILAFNWLGYKLVLFIMEKDATSRLEQRIEDGNYDPSELIEVKVPLNLPYYIGIRDYSPGYSEGGEIEIDGSVFQYVKRRVSNDTLYLTCIYHAEKNILQRADADYYEKVNTANNGNNPQKSGSLPAIKLMTSEYLRQGISADFAITVNLSTGFYLRQIQYSSQFSPSIPAPPPKA